MNTQTRAPACRRILCHRLPPAESSRKPVHARSGLTLPEHVRTQIGHQAATGDYAAPASKLDQIRALREQGRPNRKQAWRSVSSTAP